MNIEEMERLVELVKKPDGVYMVANAIGLFAALMCIYGVYRWIIEKQHISWMATWIIAISLVVSFLHRRTYHGPTFNKILLKQTAAMSICTLLLALTDPVAIYNALDF